MEHVESLLKTTLTEVERILSSRAVVGEPITMEGHTIIPLLSIGFGFGGGVKPVAVVIISKDGVRVEPVRWGTAMAGKLGEIVGTIMDKRRERK